MAGEPALRAVPPPKGPRRTSKQLGRYRLAFELASGGMATVYMACARGEASVDRVVALKQIHPHLARQEGYVEMFLDEARIASRIHHSNACGVIDFGEHEGDYFLVMEYVVGVPVNRLLATATEKLGTPDARWAQIVSRMIQDACEGLHSAHELRGSDGKNLGVVHRDVSPHNMLAGFDGSVRVVDFGIAKASDKLHVTATGQVKGKFAYMSPEQIQHGEIDRRADVYSLGVVLWEMLTLRRLFRRSNDADTMYAALEAEVPPPSRFNPGVPAKLDQLVLKALARDAEERVPTARALGSELSRLWSKHANESVDSRVVSEKLRELFPGEEERQLELIEIARAADDEVPRVTYGQADTDSFEALDVTRPEKPATKAPRDDRRLMMGALVLVTLIGGLGTALGFWFGARDGETPGDAEASAGRLAASDPGPEQPAPEPSEDPPGPATETPAPGEPASDAAPEAPPAPAAEAPPVDARSPRPPLRRRRTRGSTERQAASREEPTEAEPAPAEPPATPQTGTVAVVVPGGWARVYDESGRLLGTTPLRHELPAGPHRLELRFFGNPPAVPVQVNVPAGEVARVSRPAPE